MGRYYKIFIIIFCVCINALITLCYSQQTISPSGISGLSLWCSGDSVHLNASYIDTVYDLSGNFNNATIAISSLRPSQVNSGLNNHKAIRFDGNDDYLQISNPLDIQTVFFVFKYGGGSIASGYPTLLGCLDNPPKYIALIENGTTNFRISGETFFTDYYINTIHTNNLAPLSSYKICTGISLFNQVLNNVQVGTSLSWYPGSVFQGDLVELIIYNTSLSNLQRTQVEQYLHEKYAPSVNLGADIVISNSFCDTTLNAGNSYNSYLWSTGETTPMISVSDSGKYWVQTVDIFGITTSDTIHVAFPKINYPTGSNILCLGDTKVWNTNFPKNKFTFQWQDNSTDSLFNITQAGAYYVKITDSAGCYVRSDTLTFSVDSFINIASLGPDTSFCSGNLIYLKNGYAQTVSYLWSSGSTNDSLSISTSGQYWVSVTNNNGCVKKDTINVIVSGTAPVSDFSFNTTCFGANTQFNDLSVPPTGNSIATWSWDFGDGVTSTIQNPVHLYADTGTYIVQLKVATDVGCEASTLKIVNVYPNPIAAFSAINLCENSTVQFTCLATTFGYPITQWDWNFADVASGSDNFSSLQNPVHFYLNTGNYPVQFIVRNVHGCSDTIVNNQIIKPSPVADFVYSLACQNDSIQFTDNTILPPLTSIQNSYWDFGDATNSILLNPKHLFGMVATFNVTHLIITSNGCRDSLVKQVIIYPSPVAVFSNGSACVNLPISFNDLSAISSGAITQWAWNFNDTITSSLQNPQFLSTSSGSVSVQLKITSDLGCKDSLLQVINISSLPIADFEYNVAYGNPPIAVNFTNSSIDAGTYFWDFGDENQSSAVNPTHIYNNSGDFTVLLIVSNIDNCSDSIVKSITIINNPQNDFLPSDISGLNLWLEGDSVYVSSIDVDTLYDLSQNKNHALQTNITYQSSVLLNGHNTLMFDGIDDYFQLLNQVDIQTIFFVFKYGGGMIANGYPTLIGCVDDPPKYISIIENNSTSFRSTGATFCDDYYINMVHTNDLNPMNLYKICSGFSSFNQIINNVQIGTSLAWHPGAIFQGEIAEVIIYDTILTNGQRYSVENYLHNKYAPPVNLGPDIHLTSFCPITIDAQNRFVKYVWSTTSLSPEDTLSEISVNRSGNYSVTTTDVFGFTSVDSINIIYNSQPYLIPDTSYCLGSSLDWNTGLNKTNYSFLWQDNSTDSLFNIAQPGQYHVKITDNFGCTFSSDTINVSVDNFANTASLGPDTSLCTGNVIVLQSGSTEASQYLWSDNSTFTSMFVIDSGNYWVSVTNVRGCTAVDTIYVDIHGVAPVPGFSYQNTCFGDQTIFTDISQTLDTSHISAWQWIINQDTLTTQDITYVFSAVGTSLVQLNVTTSSNCSSTNSQNLIIHPLPVSSFIPSGLCNGSTSYFTNESTVNGGNIANWKWDFGDNSSSILINPQHVYLNAGNYIVKLLVESNFGCKDSVYQTIEVKSSPIAGFDYSPACTGYNTWFFDTSLYSPIFSILSWKWNFGDGVTDPHQNPNHGYSSIGNYNVQLIIQIANGCMDTVTKTITVFSPPKAGFIGDSSCVGVPISFVDSSDGNLYKWKWLFGNGSISNLQNPAYNYSSVGDYLVRLIVTSTDDCVDSAVKTIHVFPIPDVDFTVSPTFSPPGKPITMSNNSSLGINYWQFGDGQVSTLISPVHTYSDTGNYMIWLKVENIHGCVDSISQNVKIVPQIYDLAIIEIWSSENNGFRSDSAIIANVGTLPIYYPALTLYTDKHTPVMEIYQDTILSGQSIIYNFISQLPVSETNKPTYVCVKGNLTGGISDSDLSNNEQCIVLKSNDIILNLYPNPTSTDINLDLNIVIPGESQLEIYDKAGRIVTKNIFELQSGFNRLTIDVKDYSKGKYNIQLKAPEGSESIEFVKY